MKDLKDGEEICTNCDGSGVIIPNNIEKEQMITKYVVTLTGCPCFVCQGTGKLNWIEKVFGRKIQIPYIELPDFRGQFLSARNMSKTNDTNDYMEYFIEQYRLHKEGNNDGK